MKEEAYGLGHGKCLCKLSGLVTEEGPAARQLLISAGWIRFGAVSLTYPIREERIVARPLRIYRL